MQTKLTLRMDSELIEKVKVLSVELNISLSKIVTDYFSALVQINDFPEPSSPLLNEIMGILTDRGSDYEADYKEHLNKKYS
jgi:hypothetical protein